MNKDNVTRFMNRLKTASNGVLTLSTTKSDVNWYCKAQDLNMFSHIVLFTIGYNDDYDKAKALIEKVIRDCPLALDDPAPVVRMSGHGASAIEITTRVWVKNSDYFELQFRMYEDVKKIFDQNGISIPFNQLDVHITQN